MEPTVFDLYTERKFTTEHCFLCGTQLTTENKSREHVIPKWLQKEFDLWDLELQLLNGEGIKYRYLTIPCCTTCNSNHLSPFESTIKSAYLKGSAELDILDKEILYLWLVKIYFGLVYKELFLLTDRATPKAGTIVSEDYIKSFYSLMIFLQGIRKKHRFVNFFPGSVFIFSLRKYEQQKANWDLIDNHNRPFISIRMGGIGIIASLEDGSLVRGIGDPFEHLGDRRLHPFQFRELVAKVLYKRITLNRTPKYIVAQNGEHFETNLLSMQGLSNKDVFDDWNNNEYAEILGHLLDIPIDQCISGTKTWTCLTTEDGSFNDIQDDYCA